MVLAAEQCFQFTGGELGLLPLYAAIHSLDDPERVTDLMIEIRGFFNG